MIFREAVKNKIQKSGQIHFPQSLDKVGKKSLSQKTTYYFKVIPQKMMSGRKNFWIDYISRIYQPNVVRDISTQTRFVTLSKIIFGRTPLILRTKILMTPCGQRSELILVQDLLRTPLSSHSYQFSFLHFISRPFRTHVMMGPVCNGIDI